MNELLAQDPLVQAVSGVEQQARRNAVIHLNFDRAHSTHLVVIGDRRDRTLLGLDHFDPDVGAVGKERPVPAPRTEWAQR